MPDDGGRENPGANGLAEGDGQLHNRGVAGANYTVEDTTMSTDWSEMSDKGARRPPHRGWPILTIILSMIAGSLLTLCCLGVGVLGFGFVASGPTRTSSNNAKCWICGREQYIPALGGMGNAVHESRCPDCGNLGADIVFHQTYEEARATKGGSGAPRR